MNEKGKAIISYIFGWVGGLIVLYGMKDNTRETNIHAAQAIVSSVLIEGIAIISMFTFVIVIIPFLPIILSVLSILITIFGIIKAVNEEEPELPILGDMAKSIFKSKIG